MFLLNSHLIIVRLVTLGFYSWKKLYGLYRLYTLYDLQPISLYFAALFYLKEFYFRFIVFIFKKTY